MTKPAFRLCTGAGNHLWAALRYVERNPVRAEMVEYAADYSWSSDRPEEKRADQFKDQVERERKEYQKQQKRKREQEKRKQKHKEQ